MNTTEIQTHKRLKIKTETHRELRIEAALAGVTLEQMVDLALDAYVQKRQSEDHNKYGTGGEQPV